LLSTGTAREEVTMNDEFGARQKGVGLMSGPGHACSSGRPGWARWGRVLAFVIGAVVLFPASSWAQASPWENAVNVLMTSFTGPIARGLSLVSIVIGGVTFAFGEGGSKRILAGIIFGVGMAIGAVNFMAWLFP
jgi:type IV secretory pathway VirB2 component (pilin)